MNRFSYSKIEIYLLFENSCLIRGKMCFQSTSRKGRNMFRIESLLSARLFMAPQIVGDRIYFISNLSGRLSLYGMDFGGSVPEPLLPPHIALQNPHLIGGYTYYVFPKLAQILVMLDQDGDENYQPMVIPQAGGFPEPAFGDFFKNYRLHLGECDPEANLLYFVAESRQEQNNEAYQANLMDRTLLKLGESKWGAYIDGVSPDHNQVILVDGYTSGDNVIYWWRRETGERQLLYGVPQEQRNGQDVPLNAIHACHFTPNAGLLFATGLFCDSYGLGYLRLDQPQTVHPVAITGVVHQGAGEFEGIQHLHDQSYALFYNIDGISWVYEGTFNEPELRMDMCQVVVGREPLVNGVLESLFYDKAGRRYVLSFSTAISPTQIFTVDTSLRPEHSPIIESHTNERVLGIPLDWLAPGEDASFTSYDGTRISARLYLPAVALGYQGPHPLVYYIHGGPQSQERPDFAWFSMPLIQFLTLNGFAVFVPNVRGSSGYGLNYMKQVDRDWGGRDRLDHVHAMHELLPKDDRLDLSRVGVVGRSYGGYMSLTQAFRHPHLWKAAVDMFGPYDLISFIDRLPETWKPYFYLTMGNPADENDRHLLEERSPKTYQSQLSCPLLVIQGRNDPRVVERESRDVVENLRAQGKQIDYLVFDNEGHDVLKYENRVTCYNTIVDFFKKYLQS
jgi:pimeloyl-ACP methyl ester carboxylesterase